MATRATDIAGAVRKALGWHDAHVNLDQAVEDLPAELRGQRPPRMPHSPWEIVEHIRIAQHDILDFCRNPDYAEMKWPDDYWPRDPAPSSPGTWDASIAAFHHDLKALQDLATDPAIDPFAAIPHGSGQTYLRELILVLDHNAYHVGELVTIRRMLGAWK
jgi:uncharacterized damage-inducible protein DinB